MWGGKRGRKERFSPLAFPPTNPRRGGLLLLGGKGGGGGGGGDTAFFVHWAGAFVDAASITQNKREKGGGGVGVLLFCRGGVVFRVSGKRGAGVVLAGTNGQASCHLKRKALNESPHILGGIVDGYENPKKGVKKEGEPQKNT